MNLFHVFGEKIKNNTTSQTYQENRHWNLYEPSTLNQIHWQQTTKRKNKMHSIYAILFFFDILIYRIVS